LTYPTRRRAPIDLPPGLRVKICQGIL
jgi:hypothetical protein